MNCKQDHLASSEKASYVEPRKYFSFARYTLHFILLVLPCNTAQDYTHLISKNYGNKRHFTLTCKIFQSPSILNALTSLETTYRIQIF